MGIESVWSYDVVNALDGIGIATKFAAHDKYELLCCNDKLVLNLIPLYNSYQATELLDLQAEYQNKNIYLVQLWEDVWFSRKAQVLGRIKSILGLNKRLHARKAKIISVNQQVADAFFNENHIQASARAKYKLALHIDDQIIAVASFSGPRLMKRISSDYRSVELIRFATRIGFSIPGGFSKLISHFIKMVDPNDIMSYADRDWSLGNAYEQSGFTFVDTIAPAAIWLKKEGMRRIFPQRLPVSILQVINEPPVLQNSHRIADEFVPVFNTGNLKYILYLK